MMKDTPQGQTNHCPMCEDAAKKILELEQRVKHSCWMQMERPINRYLMANAHGRRDGALKAHVHIELCSIMIAIFRGETFFENELIIHPDFEAVHDATAELTSYMDEQIGFPLDSTPDYEALAPKFFEKFYALGTKALCVALTPLPKESNSPETDLDEALRRQ